MYAKELVKSKVCILCRINKPNSKEHVIPAIIGGRFQARVLCRDCNSITGYLLHNSFKTDPKIKIAMGSLRLRMLDLYDKYTNKTNLVGYIKDDEKIHLKKKDGVLKISTSKYKKGSIIMDPASAPTILMGMVKKNDQSVNEDSMNLLLQNLKEGEPKYISDSIRIQKKSLNRITPDLTTTAIDPRAILCVVYQFIYLFFSDQILNDNFNFIRKSIMVSPQSKRIKIDSFYSGQKYLPIHAVKCFADEKLKLDFIIFNAIHNIVEIENIKMIDNKGHLFIDDFENNQFFYTNDLSNVP